ncbi:hypothetical protein BDC45DRAFT_590621 [Circinella umbellata]|nr:hypothetical protein BDC45DRAFT_590621 [Circinella umbellata]
MCILFYVRPLVDELISLQSRGMQVIGTDDEITNATAHLLFATGDILAAATLCSHESHIAIYGCRICIIKTTRLQSMGGTGYGRYFLGSLDTDDAIRDHIQFAKGGLDVFTRPNQGRAVDYIDMLPYMGPALLLESFVKINSCSDKAITAFISIVTVCGLGLKWEINNEDIEVMKRCAATWHRFVYLNMLHNIYTVNIHYVCKHLTTTIKKMGPLQTYSARCMERTVGSLGRRLKSKSAIAQNAQNQMVMLAAYRDLAAMTMTNRDDGSESNQALNDDSIFQLGNGSDEIQIFNAHQSLLDSYERWNLKNLVHNYWTQKYPHEQGHIIDEIMVGTVLHIQGSIFSTEINKEPKNARIRNFVQLSLVQLNPVFCTSGIWLESSAKTGGGAEIGVENIIKSKWDFGQKVCKKRECAKSGALLYTMLTWLSIPLFLFYFVTYSQHILNDYEYILCLVRIYTNLQANEARVAYGTQSHHSHNGRLYVTHVQDIEGHRAYIPSAEHNGRYYYPIVGFIPNELKLGKTHLI